METELTGDNQFSPKFIVYKQRDFNVSIRGTFVATITVQRSFDNGIIWRDVQIFSIEDEWVGRNAERCKYRIGIKSGNYTSGTAYVRLGR